MKLIFMTSTIKRQSLMEPKSLVNLPIHSLSIGSMYEYKVHGTSPSNDQSMKIGLVPKFRHLFGSLRDCLLRMQGTLIKEHYLPFSLKTCIKYFSDMPMYLLSGIPH